MTEPTRRLRIMALDWPNLLVGFLFGVVGTIPFWLVERQHARAAVAAQWTRATRRIETLLWNDQTRAVDLLNLTEELPIDHWRTSLGPNDFRVLERLQNSLWTAEHAATQHARVAASFYTSRNLPIPHPDITKIAYRSRVDPEGAAATPLIAHFAKEIEALRSEPEYLTAEESLERANQAQREAKIEFINLARKRARDEYTSLIRREERRAIVRHPWREGRRAFKMRRAMQRHRRRRTSTT